MFDSIHYLRAIKKIMKGGTGKVSYAMICNASINLWDAKRKLTSEQFDQVKKLYDNFMTCKTKFSVDLEGWWTLAKDVIDRFDEIAPYEKYFGGNEFEMAILQNARKKEEKAVQIDQKGRDYIEYLVESGTRAKLTYSEAEDIYLIIKNYNEVGKENALKKNTNALC